MVKGIGQLQGAAMYIHSLPLAVCLRVVISPRCQFGRLSAHYHLPVDRLPQ